MSRVLWGIGLRIWLLQTGYLAVGHFAHKSGKQTWAVEDVAVQGYNLPRLGWITFGKNWHGNSRAFPHSARLGVGAGAGEADFLVLRALARMGLVWIILGPNNAPPRDGIKRLRA